MVNSMGYDNYGDDVCDWIAKDHVLRIDPEATFDNLRAYPDIDDFDAFLVAGGGLFYEPQGEAEVGESTSFYGEVIKQFKDAGKKVIVLSVGCQTPIANKEFINQLERADFISLRFKANRELFQPFKAKIIESADLLWLTYRPPEEYRFTRRGILISAMSNKNPFISQLERILERYEENEEPIFLLDNPIPNNYVEELKKRFRMNIFDYHSPYEIGKYNVSQHRVFGQYFAEVSTFFNKPKITFSVKFHTLIESAKHHIPTYTMWEYPYTKIANWCREYGFSGDHFEKLRDHRHLEERLKTLEANTGLWARHSSYIARKMRELVSLTIKRMAKVIES